MSVFQGELARANEIVNVITQKQLANYLGVSRQLVGLALSGGTVAETTRERILQAAAELGYRPNEIARAMVTGKNRVIGFLGHSVEMEAMARLLSGVLDGIGDDYSVKVIRYHENDHAEAMIDRCMSLRLAGVVVNYLPTDERALFHKEMKRYQIPMVVLDSTLPHPGVLRVMSDDDMGCRLAIDHLVALGHRQIAFVSATPNNDVSTVRERSFYLAMEAHCLSVPTGYLVHGYWERPMLRTAQRVSELLAAADARPSAVFCVDDKTAMIVLREARRCRLSVPEDLSVIGFADLDMAEFATPPLTTIAQPFEQIGQVAARQLIQTIEACNRGEETDIAEDAIMEKLLPTRLVIRETTARAPS